MPDKSPEIIPDDVARLVTLVFGTMSDGNPYWCIVAVKPSRYEEFQAVTAGKRFDINRYTDEGFGEIVVSGEGVLPPNDVMRTVAAMFNVPIRQLFQDIDTATLDAIIAKEVERVKKELDGE